MNALFNSYLAYARGEARRSAWRLLVPLGWLAAGLTSLRDWQYRHGLKASIETALPVVSVGNLTTGGTNKTPFVEYLVRGFRDRGVAAGVVSRGYGGASRGARLFRNGRAQRELVGDEPLLLSNRLRDVPVAVSPDRLAGVALLAGQGCDLVVADDCFQHRRLDRDCDIVLVDATCPFGNGHILPCGTLRESPSALVRAQLVVVTKTDEVSADRLRDLEARLQRYVHPERLFRSRLSWPRWVRWIDGQLVADGSGPAGRRVFAFSAIGNPDSFLWTLRQDGQELIGSAQYKDHHRFTADDLLTLTRRATGSGATGLCCTEKDIYNLPREWCSPLPLWVPLIGTQLEDEVRFWHTLTESLRPRLVVASNGYGEDAIGALLARALADAMPDAEVAAFPLVGRGDSYRIAGIPVAVTPSVTPSGGVVKYRLRDLLSDLRAGLLGHIKSQMRCWEKVRTSIRTPLCVGDFYMVLHALWGQGRAPLLVATAKTELLHGHMKVERWLYRTRTRQVWTRDEQTCAELAGVGVRSRFAGNPIMDLAQRCAPQAHLWADGRRVLVLPGSRDRTYRDLPLLLAALELIAGRVSLSAVLVMASSITTTALARAAAGWQLAENDDGTFLCRRNTSVRLYGGQVAEAAPGAEVLLGLAGTANQVCAGLGVPVVSVDERGKRVQQKLLAGAEILVPATPEALAGAVISLLNDEGRRAAMAAIGRQRLGSAGMIDDAVRWVSETMGWKRRSRVWRTLMENASHTKEGV